MKRSMMKRMMSLLLCLCMVLSYVPATVFAAEADGLCHHHEEHSAECGYVPAVEGNDCTHECGEDCAEGCIHTEHDEACGYKEAVAEQPCAYGSGCETCAAEAEAAKKAAEEEAAKKAAEEAAKASAEAVESVRALIDALPSLEELEAMSWEDQQVAYTDTLAADEAYQALTDAQKAQLTEENAKLDELFGYINTLTAPVEQTAENSAASVTVGSEVTYYATFAEALKAANAADKQNGATIKLLKDINANSSYLGTLYDANNSFAIVSGAVTIDFNNHKIYLDGFCFEVSQNATLKLEGTGKYYGTGRGSDRCLIDNAGALYVGENVQVYNSANYKKAISSTGYLNVSGTVDHIYNSGATAAAYVSGTVKYGISNNGGTVYVEQSSQIGTGNPQTSISNTGKGIVNIYDGTITNGKISADSGSVNISGGTINVPLYVGYDNSTDPQNPTQGTYVLTGGSYPNGLTVNTSTSISTAVTVADVVRSDCNVFQDGEAVSKSELDVATLSGEVKVVLPCSTCTNFGYKTTTTTHTKYCKDCGTPVANSEEKHVWSEDSACTVCTYTCEHSFESGVCTICGGFCFHNEFGADGVCTNCGFDPVVKVTVEGDYWYSASLADAMETVPNDGKQATLTLLANATEKITIEDGMDVVFEGGEHSLTVTDDTVITVKAGKLEIASGTVQGNTTAYIVIHNISTGTVTVTGGTVSGSTGIRNHSTGNVIISGGTVNSYNTGIENYSTGSVTVTSGTVDSSNTGISNESTGSVTVSGGSVEGNTYGINNNGTLNISGGSVTSTTSYGIYNKGGIKITGGTITGGDDGIYIEGTNGKIIDISGGTISGKGNALNNAGGSTYISLSGGTFIRGYYTPRTGQSSQRWLRDGCKFVYLNSGNDYTGYAALVTDDLKVVCSHKTWTDGVCAACGAECEHDTYTEGICDTCGLVCQHSSYDTDSKCTACGLTCTHGSWTEGVCTACGAEAMASVTMDGTTSYYANLVKAMMDIPTDGTQATLTLLANATGSITIKDGMDVVFEGGEYSLSSSANFTIIVQTAKLEVASGTVTGNLAAISNNSGSIVVSGGTVNGTDGTNGVGIQNTGTGGNIAVSGGKVTGVSYGIYHGSSATVTVSGGTVESSCAIYNTSSGKVIVSGGIVSGTDVGIANASTASVEISGGTVTATGEEGTAINNRGSMTVTSGTVSATEAGSTGIVNINSTSIVSISGGMISGDEYALNTFGNSENITLSGGVYLGGIFVSYGYSASDPAVNDLLAEGYKYALYENNSVAGDYTSNPYRTEDDLAVICGHENWTNDKCDTCGLVCQHSSYSNGFCTLCDKYETATDSDGDGYYEIDNAGKLYWFAAVVNSGYGETAQNAAMDAILTDNITVNTGTVTASSTSARKWTPILAYTGKFDGNEKTVSGLYVTTGSDVGLFGSTDGATIQDVGVIKSYFAGAQQVGAIVGNGTGGSLTGCYSTSTVSGELNVGGLAGYFNGTVTNCYNTGSVYGSKNVGGLVGNGTGSTVTGCYNSGDVICQYLNLYSYAGGIVGYNYVQSNTGSISKSYNTGKVSGTGEGVGGIAGYVNVSIEDCYNVGEITGVKFTGGIVGKIYGSSKTVKYCHNYGTVTSTQYGGAIAGQNNSVRYSSVYYLENTASLDLGTGTETIATSFTAEQFASGAVCVLLDKNAIGNSRGVWKQNLGSDAYPVFTGSAVYAVENCKGETVYSNTNENIGHIMQDDACTVCGKSVVASVTVNGTTTNYLTMAEAMAAVPVDGTKATVTLLDDATTGITVTDGMNIKLAGGDYSIAPSSGHPITITGGKLEVVSGTISTTSDYGYPIYATGGQLTLSGDAKVTATGNFANVIYGSNVAVTVEGNAELTAKRGVALSSGSITVSGGSITATGSSTSAIDASGTSTVTVSGGTVSGTYYAISNASGTVTVSGGEVTGGEDGIYSGGKVTINGGTVEGETNGISTSMSAGLITVNEGSVEGGTNGIYCVGTSSVTITGGTVTGGSYAVRNNGSGSITVSGGAVTSTEGGGIYNFGGGAIAVSGGTITGTGTGNSKYALYNHCEAKDVSLSGGIFVGGIYAANDNSEEDATVADLLANGYQYQFYYPDTEIVGGVYAASVHQTTQSLIVTCDHTRIHKDNVPATCQTLAYCGSCKQSYGGTAAHVIDNATGYCVYDCDTYMAKATVTIGAATTYYTKATEALASEAVTNLTTGQTATVKLLDNISENASIQAPAKNIVLDLNGKTLAVWVVSVSGTGANLTVKDSTASAEGVLQAKYNVAVSNGSVLTLESGKIHARMDNTINGGINVANGTLNITGGTVAAKDHGIYVVDSRAVVNISGGTIQDSGAGDKYALYNREGVCDDITLSGGVFMGGVYASAGSGETPAVISDLLADGYKYAEYDTASGIGADFPNAGNCCYTGEDLTVVCGHKDPIHTADEETNTITATCSNTECYKYGEVIGTLVLTAADYTYNSEEYDAYEATVIGTGIYADTTLTADYAQEGNALTGAPSKAGSYTASLTVDGVTVSDDFVVDQATLTPSISGTAVKNYDGTNQVTEGQLSINLTGICAQDSVQATATFLYGQTGVGENITITAGDIQLTGTDAGNYKLSTNLVTAKVGTIDPMPVAEVTFPNTLPVVYGTTLGEAGFTGGDGSGTFAWEDETLKPDVDNEGYAMVFTPRDTENYDYSNVAGWNATDKTVVRNVAIQVSKANPGIGTVSASDVKDSTDISKVELTRSNTAVAGILTLNAGQTLRLGENTLAYTFTPSSGNYKVVGGTVTVNVVDTIAPTGTVTLAENTWNTFLNKITFGLFFNKTQTVTVTAQDSFSGVDSIEYYTTDKVMDLADVKALADSKWTQMKNGKVNVTAEDAKQFIYYIRITDKSGNVAYLATNGAEFDTTVPVITGVEDGETYTETREVTVTDKNLKTVTLNGETVTGTITLTCDVDVEKEYTIVAIDKAGNTTTVKVTMAAVCDGGETCPCAPYGDVDTSLWYHEAIDYVIENGLMQGHPGKVFGPDEILTRAQMVQILYNLEGRPAVSGEDNYTDTDPSQWYTDPILWATKQGIVEGYGDGKFGPSDPLTREQMVTILYRYSRLKSYDLSIGSYSSFPDAASVSSYAETPMAWAIGKGIIIGMDDGTLCPSCKSTRAQVATVLMRYVEMFK